MATDSYLDILTGNADAARLNAQDLKTIIKRKIDTVNTYLKYVGEAGPGALDSEAVWRIRREITQGALTTISYASPAFDQVWDDRATLTYENGAPSVPFNNTISTQFDGINDYVTIGDAFNYEHSQQFSASIWIKPNNFAALRYYLGNIDLAGTVYGWRLGISTLGELTAQTRVNGGAYAPTTFTDLVMVAGTWNHVVFKWLGGSNNNQTRMYLNGVLSAIIPSVGSMVTSWLTANNLEIGRAYSNYFVGNIDEVSLFNKALSDSEVAELFNAGTPIDPSTSSVAGNLTNWYRMGDGDTFPTITNNAMVGENGTMTNMVAGAFVLDVP